MFRTKSSKILDNFYINICNDIDEKLKTYTIPESTMRTPSGHVQVGLHSTTHKSFEKIMKDGFNNRDKDAIIWGEMNNWPIAMFATPYIDGDTVDRKGIFDFRRRGWCNHVSILNGINRTIDTYGLLLHGYDPETMLDFPMIIAIFKKNETTTTDGYICVFENPNENITIIGEIKVILKIKDYKRIMKIKDSKDPSYSNYFTEDIQYIIKWH